MSVLRNLTPHNIVILADNGTRIVYHKADTVARLVSRRQEQIGHLDDGCPVFTPQEFVAIDPKTPNLSKEECGVIVSMPVGEWLRQNGWGVWGEVYCADTGPNGVVRDANGNIVGTKRLVRYK